MPETAAPAACARAVHIGCGQGCGQACANRVSRLAPQGLRNIGEKIAIGFPARASDASRRRCAPPRPVVALPSPFTPAAPAQRPRRSSAPGREVCPHRMWTRLRTSPGESGFTPCAARAAGFWTKYRQPRGAAARAVHGPPLPTGRAVLPVGHSAPRCAGCPPARAVHKRCGQGCGQATGNRVSRLVPQGPQDSGQNIASPRSAAARPLSRRPCPVRLRRHPDPARRAAIRRT